MATGRMLNRSIAKSHDVAQLVDRANAEMGPHHGAQAALLFTWSIPFLDVAGRMHGDPRLVRSEVMPLLENVTTADVADYLGLMASIGLVVWYAGPDGRRWLAFPGFERAQPGLRKDRETESLIPSPDQCVGVTPELLRHYSGIDPGEEKRREEKRREGEQKRLPPPPGTQGVLLVVQDPPKPSPGPSSAKNVYEPSADALAVLEEFNRRRKRSVKGARAVTATKQNLEFVEERLADGNTLDDLLHVVAVAEGYVIAGEPSKWFTLETPFRKANITRYLQAPAPEIRILRSLPAPESAPIPYGISPESWQETLDATAGKLDMEALLEWDREHGGGGSNGP